MLQLTIEKISLSLSKKEIIKNLSFDFQQGCYAILGENGIGKTTLLEAIAGIYNLNRGKVKLHDKKPYQNNTFEYKKRLTYVPSKSLFYPTAKGKDFINFMLSVKKVGSVCNIERINAYITKFHLNEYLNYKFKEMSLGTQKKFFLMTMLIGSNQLILLDEPSNALDIEAIDTLKALLNELSHSTIIIMVTHDKVFLSNLNTHLLRISNSPIESFNLHQNNLL